MSGPNELTDLEPQDGGDVKGGSVEPDELSRLRRDPASFAQEYPGEVADDIT